MDLITRQELAFIEPALHATALQGIVQPPGKDFVRMAVTDETGIDSNGFDSMTFFISVRIWTNKYAKTTCDV